MDNLFPAIVFELRYHLSHCFFTAFLNKTVHRSMVPMRT